MRRLLLLTCFMYSIVYSQSPRQDLDTFCEEIQQRTELEGFAISLIHQDSILFMKAYGFADVKSKTPYTTKTIQSIGLASQSVLGTAMMRAVELGMMELDKPVNEYLPFKVYHTRYPGEEITIRHLATHSSGLLDRYHVHKKAYLPLEEELPSLEKVVRSYASIRGRAFKRRHYIRYKPGDAYTFSHYGASMLALAIEGASKQVFTEFTKEEIFRPLGMKSTYWHPSLCPEGTQASLYLGKGQGIPNYQLSTYPSNGLRTNCEDLSKFLISNIQWGEPVLEALTYRELITQQFHPEELPVYLPRDIQNTGLLWNYYGGGRMGLFALDKGVICMMFFHPDTGEGRILIANSSSKKAREAAWAVIREMGKTYQYLFPAYLDNIGSR